MVPGTPKRISRVHWDTAEKASAVDANPSFPLPFTFKAGIPGTLWAAGTWCGTQRSTHSCYSKAKACEYMAQGGHQEVAPKHRAPAQNHLIIIGNVVEGMIPGGAGRSDQQTRARTCPPLWTITSSVLATFPIF